MNYPFNPSRGSIELVGEVSGPLGKVELRLLLDTGASNSLVSENLLVFIGYDPASSTDLVKVAMGNGVEVVPRIIVNRFTALGAHRIGFPIVAKSLPPEAGVDGLLGLDFLRGHVPTLDFQVGLLTLA